ncbi:unnamed protein product [Diamesa serratosioi]
MNLLHGVQLMILVGVINCKTVFNYDGYKVYDVKVGTIQNADFLNSLMMHKGIDVWSLHKVLGSNATIMVSPESQDWFEKAITEASMDYKSIIMDLEILLIKERMQPRTLFNHNERLPFDRYYRHDEINEYLENQSSSKVQVKTVGKSFEGREIKTITITNGDGKKKNSVFIDAGIHAREWIAPATALYLVDQLLDSNSSYSKVLDQMDIVIMPVVNPDGYEYSHSKQRLWRKTRSFSKSLYSEWYLYCIGTDGNRNFDFHWGEIGASSECSAETYRGKKAFSELETQALRDAVESIKEDCKFYLTLHSFGQYLLYPWGYTEELPETWKDLHEVANAGADAIYNSTGAIYTVGSSTNVLYAAAGGSDDWAFAVTDVPISFVMELPGGGNLGFDLPARDIDKTVKESAVGIFAMIVRVNDKYPN